MIVYQRENRSVIISYLRLNNFVDQKMSVMHGKMKKTDTIIVFDNCTFSRFATEDILSKYAESEDILSFACVSDFRNWDRDNNRRERNCIAIINASSSPLYGEDVPGFLFYEKERKMCRRILLIRRKSGQKLYKNLVLTHFLAQHNKFVEIYDINETGNGNINNFRGFLIGFINTAPEKIADLQKTKYKESQKVKTGDAQVLRMVMSGKTVREYSVDCDIPVKTLYSQRAAFMRRKGWGCL